MTAGSVGLAAREGGPSQAGRISCEVAAIRCRALGGAVSPSPVSDEGGSGQTSEAVAVISSVVVLDGTTQALMHIHRH